MSIVSNHFPEVLDELNERTEPDRRERVSRKPRQKPERRIRILEQPTPDTAGWAAIAITVGKKTDTYLLHTVPTKFGDDIQAFEIEKLNPDLATIANYHVLLSADERSCECLGFLRHSHCKHVDGIAALTAARKI